MAEAPDTSESSAGDPFEIAKIRQLVRLMRDNDLSEIDLRRGETRIRLRRGAPNDDVAGIPLHPEPRGSGEMSIVPASSSPAAAESKSSVASDRSVVIKSPIVGTFYAASTPDAEPFVKVGSKVTNDTIVCIVEAMKVFNEIQADITGTIVEILVENGAAVEYGQPLFRVET